MLLPYSLQLPLPVSNLRHCGSRSPDSWNSLFLTGGYATLPACEGLIRTGHESYVMHIRGTPTTVLSRLLEAYAKQHHPETTTVRLVWQLNKSEGRRGARYRDFIYEESQGSITFSDFDNPRKPILIIVDEAQLPYTDHGCWIELVKCQATLSRTPNLRIALLSSWGSASDEVLKVPGSAPILLSADQGVDLIPQSGWQHSLPLFFDYSDVEDVGKWMLLSQGTGSKLGSDVMKYIHRVSNGHPGLTMAIFGSLLGHPIYSPPRIILLAYKLS